MADPEKRVKQIIRAVPGMDWEDFISLGLRLLNKELNVDDMYMETHKNGVSIHMRLEDRESVEKAKAFWEENMGRSNNE